MNDLKNWFVKWIIFIWFIVSNGFNLKKANEDAAQTLRKVEWDIKNDNF